MTNLEGAEKRGILLTPDIIQMERKKHGYSESEAASLLLLATIANLLFPKNFAKPLASGMKKGDGTVPVIFQYYRHDKEHEIMLEYKLKKIRGLPTTVEEDKIFVDLLNKMYQSEPYKQFVEEVLECGFFRFERAPFNFIKGGEGSLIFVDFEPAFLESRDGSSIYNLNFDIEKLKTAIESRLDGEDQEIAKKCFNEIIDLLPKGNRHESYKF